MNDLIHYFEDPNETVCGIPLFGSCEDKTEIFELVTCHSCRWAVAQRNTSPPQPDPYDRGYAAALNAVKTWGSHHPPNHACDVCDAIQILARTWARQAAFDAAATGPDKIDDDRAALIADSICREGYPITNMIDDAKPGPAIALAARIARSRVRLTHLRPVAREDFHVLRQTDAGILDWTPGGGHVEETNLAGWSLTVRPSSDGKFWIWNADFPDGEHDDSSRYSGAKFEGQATTNLGAKAAALEIAKRTMLG